MSAIKKPKEPAFVAATLRWCNARRAERGVAPLRQLPKGRRFNGNSCPCGKATKLFIGSLGFAATAAEYDELTCLTGLPRRKNRIPKSVEVFVDKFDSGLLSQYEEAAQ